MPIRPENKARYPANWSAISRAIKDRARWCCEHCGAAHGQPNPVTSSRVVLTTAHLDHVPENCDPSNLRALCQRCHLAYDKGEHAKTRRERRKAIGRGRALTVDAEQVGTQPAQAGVERAIRQPV